MHALCTNLFFFLLNFKNYILLSHSLTHILLTTTNTHNPQYFEYTPHQMRVKISYDPLLQVSYNYKYYTRRRLIYNCVKIKMNTEYIPANGSSPIILKNLLLLSLSSHVEKSVTVNYKHNFT